MDLTQDIINGASGGGTGGPSGAATATKGTYIGPPPQSKQDFRMLTLDLLKKASDQRLGYKDTDIYAALDKRLGEANLFGGSGGNDTAQASGIYYNFTQQQATSLIDTARVEVYKPVFDRAYQTQIDALNAASVGASSFEQRLFAQAAADMAEKRDTRFGLFMSPAYGQFISSAGGTLSAAQFVGDLTDLWLGKSMNVSGVFGPTDVAGITEHAKAYLQTERQREAAVADGKKQLTALTETMTANGASKESVNAVKQGGESALASYAMPGGGFAQGIQVHDWMNQNGPSVAANYGAPPAPTLVGMAQTAITVGQQATQNKYTGEFLKVVSGLTTEQQAALGKVDPVEYLKRMGTTENALAQITLDADKAKNTVRDAGTAAQAAADKAKADEIAQGNTNWGEQANKTLAAQSPEVMAKLRSRFGIDPAAFIFQKYGKDASTIFDHEVKQAQGEVTNTANYTAGINGTKEFNQQAIHPDTQAKIKNGSMLDSTDAANLAKAHLYYGGAYGNADNSNGTTAGTSVVNDLWTQSKGDVGAFGQALTAKTRSTPGGEMAWRSTLPGFYAPGELTTATNQPTASQKLAGVQATGYLKLGQLPPSNYDPNDPERAAKEEERQRLWQQMYAQQGAKQPVAA